MPGLLDAVKAWLRSQYSIHVPDDWLEACAEWIQSEQGRLSPGQLRQAIYEQWLLSDVRELAHACLPELLATSEKFMLEGKFSLQVDQVRDISQPGYGQLKKMHGRENENAQVNTNTQFTQPTWEARSSRMLMLGLTDGVQDVQGMEYQTIRQINVNLPPGTKVTIVGPVLCRLGVLMLSDKNVRVLGGEVEALLEDNNLTAVLARHLNLDPQNLPSNLRPKSTVNLLSQAPPTQNQPANQAPPHPRQTNQRQTTLTNQVAPERVTANQRGGQSQAANQRATRGGHVTVDDGFQDGDGVFDQIDVDLLTDHWDEDDDMDVLMSQINVPATSRPPPAVTSTSTVTSRQTPAMTSRAAPSVTSTNARRKTPSPKPESSSRTNPTVEPMNRSVSSKSSHSDMDCEFPDDDDDLLLQTDLTDITSGTEVSFSRAKPITPSTANAASRNDTIYDVDGRDGLNDVRPSTSTAADVSAAANFDMDFFEDDFDIPTSPKRSKIEAEKPKSDSEKPLSERISDLMKKKGELKRTDRPLRMDSEPYMYLRQVLAMMPVKGETTVRVKAYVSTVVKKLAFNKGRFWSLGVKINDGTASLDTDMTDQVISGLMTFSASEACKMRRQGVQDMDIRNRVQEALAEFQRKLIDLSCIFVISLSPEESKIVELVDFTESHAEKLYERLMRDHVK